ncbi:hypothetical protein XENTR_v10020676 [Xenopus tropicalis]|uniref:Uncharacterized protein LOC100488687 n=1 Tax=Xenopus tropicalis TaxID=8364 RepID=A0A8J0QX81_XENTR|nr:uncharacterized protein LOC100488687 [Xenopus tropicalis]KAE8583761.1 hypothetical protein XENTR_v10020676 [Xenopus tropicalis]|eukprot:XP_002940450.1 PREDICTED: uncharacterized protein LOC100488687 [Xenopus tropicalis]
MSKDGFVAFLYVCIYILLQQERAWGCTLTSDNFRTVLEWQTKESNCDIQLFNGSEWNSLSTDVVPVCKDGSCKVDLSWQMLNIYADYQAKILCPHGSKELNCTTPVLQLYNDVIPGPPLLNVSLEDGKLHMCVSLPLAPGITSNSAPRPIQSILKKLQNLILTVTTGNLTYCSEHIILNKLHCMDCKDLLPDSEYCATATFRDHHGKSARKCVINRDFRRLTYAVKAASPLVIFVFVILVWGYKAHTSLPKPKVLEFPYHFPRTLLLKENKVIIDSLSLMPPKWEYESTKTQFVKYERNGFLEQLDPGSVEEVEETWGSGETSECSVAILSASQEETPQPFTHIPEEWNNLSNINLNSILVMEKESNLEGLVVDGKPSAADQDVVSVADSSELWNSDKEEDNCEEQLQHFSGYERQGGTLFLSPVH